MICLSLSHTRKYTQTSTQTYLDCGASTNQHPTARLTCNTALETVHQHSHYPPITCLSIISQSVLSWISRPLLCPKLSSDSVLSFTNAAHTHTQPCLNKGTLLTFCRAVIVSVLAVPQCATASTFSLQP